MKRFLILIVLIASCAINMSAHATESLDKWELSNKDRKHVKDANYWAGRDRWLDSNQHASKAEDPRISRLFKWLQYISNSKYTSFEEVSAFIKDNPQWPRMQKLQVVMESAIKPDTDKTIIVDWFTQHKDAKSQRRTFSIPVTANGKRILAEAIIAMGKKISSQNKAIISQLVRSAWIEGNFGAADKKTFLIMHGAILRQSEHQSRIERLLWDNMATDAKHMLKLIKDKSKRKLYTARYKVQKNVYGLDSALRKVPRLYKNDEGLLFDRIKWRMKHSNIDGVIQLLQKAPSKTKYHKQWWKIKKRYIAALIKDKQYDKAYKLASQNEFINNVGDFAASQWKSGWIAYYYQHNPQKAYKHFYKMFQRVQTPISLGRASYWSGRMAQQNRNAGIARKWYKVAAQYSTSFYGQLATENLGQSSLTLPQTIAPTIVDYETYYNNELLKAAYILNQMNRHREAQQFIRHAMSQAKSLEDKVLITQFGKEINRLDYGVIAAKILARDGEAVDIINNYPLIENLVDIKGRNITKPEAALIHSIILQESIFDNTARSYVGAKGLMQLMPATAKEVARRNRITYNKNKLFNPEYNITLGSNYLAQLIKQFNGSYILAIAAYNGGQGNVRKWIRANGDPREMKTVEEVIDWVEKIPFNETQNYLQRVIENLQIYRYKINDSSQPYVRVVKDLTR